MDETTIIEWAAVALASVIVSIPLLALMVYIIVTEVFDMVRLVLELTIDTGQSRVSP